MDRELDDDLRLLRNIIYRMNLPTHALDEAWSAGQIALVTARNNYKPESGVPLGAWMAIEMRQWLMNWQKSELRQPQAYVDESLATVGYGSIESLALLLSIEQAIDNVLSAQERFVLKASMFGLRMTEICAAIRINGKQAAALLRSAREKIGREIFA